MTFDGRLGQVKLDIEERDIVNTSVSSVNGGSVMGSGRVNLVTGGASYTLTNLGTVFIDASSDRSAEYKGDSNDFDSLLSQLPSSRPAAA